MTTPLELFQRWLPGVPGSDGYFPLMALATVDLDGNPDVRTVLLSGISNGNLLFHTDSRSRKVGQLQRTPMVALMITLPERGRQVVLRGPARQQTVFELAAGYRARSGYLRLLAWLNTPQMSAQPIEERHRQWAQFAATHPNGSLRPPPEWVGFAVDPHRITFWEADLEGPSHRVEYTMTAGDWTSVHLPG